VRLNTEEKNGLVLSFVHVLDFLSRMLQTWGFQDEGIICNLEHCPLPRNSKIHVKLKHYNCHA